MSKAAVRRCLLSVVGLLLGALAFAAEFYVSPSGSASGNGSQGSPWDLQTALNQPSSVHPGDTIWLRGGTYVGYFVSDLSGTSTNPIIVRQYPGERATIDGNYAGTETALNILGSYSWFWGFEIFNSDPTRYTSDANYPPRRGEGLGIFGNGNKAINLIIHDTSEGVLTTSGYQNAEVSGCLIYYNGYDSPDRGHGHGIYVQNATPSTRLLQNNVIFRQFGAGIHAYSEGGYVDDINIQSNTSFNNGELSQVSGFSWNVVLGNPNRVSHNPIVNSNAFYSPTGQGTNKLGYGAGCSTPTVTGNYFASATPLNMNCTGVTMTGNTFYDSDSISGFTSSQYPNNTYYSSRPTGTWTVVAPNSYESGRAHITVYNWDLQSTVSVDVSGILAAGDGYEIRNVSDIFGAPVLTGTYDGSPLVLPMTGLSVATPVGRPAPPATGPEFNAFVLTSTLGPYEFYDVAQSNPFHDAIHTIAANGITAGCGNGNYCPNAPVSRAQMAVFLLKGKHGAQYVPPPATGSVFNDVPASAFAAAWIEQLAAEGISSGCGGGNFCAGASATRAQMAVFLLKASLGSAYTPPAATGTVFTDVPASAFAASWIEDLAARGITSGCGGGNYCPASPNTRGQMAVFLVATFGLQ